MSVGSQIRSLIQLPVLALTHSWCSLRDVWLFDSGGLYVLGACSSNSACNWQTNKSDVDQAAMPIRRVLGKLSPCP